MALEQPVGYAIEINDIIVEFVQKASPYLLFAEDYGNMKFYYDYANYGFFENETVICFELEG